MRHTFIPLAVCLCLFACGGGSDQPTEQELLLAEAHAVEAEARSLAMVSPCTADFQCVAIGLVGIDRPCRQYSWIPHSWASATGYAPAAAAQRLFVLSSQIPKVA